MRKPINWKALKIVRRIHRSSFEERNRKVKFKDKSGQERFRKLKSNKVKMKIVHTLAKKKKSVVEGSQGPSRPRWSTRRPLKMGVMKSTPTSPSQ